MPQVNITVSKKLDDSTKNTLQFEIGTSIAILPGKNIGNAMICIQDGVSTYKNGEPVDGLFAEIRLYKNSPEESKKEYSEKLFQIFESVLGIKPELVYINFVELATWAAGGSYF